MLSNLREIAFFFRVYYRPCSIIYWLPLWKLFIGGPICGDIYEACLRLYVSCSTHDYISKTKQDRPIVIMKHWIERSTMSHLDPLPGAPLAAEPALGEGEQGPRPGPRACGGPAGHQRGAPHHAKTPRGGASARGTADGSVSGVRHTHFWAPAMCGPKRIVTRKRLIARNLLRWFLGKSLKLLPPDVIF